MIYIPVGNQKGHAIIWVIYRAISWDSWCHSSSLLLFSCSNNCTCSQIQRLSRYFQKLCNSLRPRPYLALFGVSKSKSHFMWSCRCAGLCCRSWDEALEKGPIAWLALDLVIRREVPPPLKSLCPVLSFPAHSDAWVLLWGAESLFPGTGLSSLSRDIQGPYSKERHHGFA